MADFLDICRFTSSSLGTADFEDGPADQGFLNLSSAGAVDGAVYPYRAENVTRTEWEIGYATALLTSDGIVMLRNDVRKSSDGDAKVNFTTNPVVLITVLSNDMSMRTIGPGATVVDGEIAVFDGTTGKAIKGSGIKADNGIVLPVLSADPAAPSAGEVILYEMDDGNTYKRDSTGEITKLGSGGGGDNVDALFFDNRVQGMHLAEAMAQPMFLGPDGSALHDGFDTLNYVDDVSATNLDTSEAGCLKASSVSTTIATSDLNASAANFIAPALTIVQLVPASAFGATATSVSVRFRAAAASTLPIANAYIGLKAPSGDAYDFAGTPVRLTFGGANGTTVTAGNYVDSDPVPFTIDGSTAVLIAYDCTTEPSGGTSDRAARTVLSGWQCYFKTSTEAGLVNKTGYTDYTATQAVMGIDSVRKHVFDGVDVRSHPIAAAVDPATMRAALRMYDAAGITLNTDTTIQLSRDGGTTWATAVLVERYTQPGDVRVLDTGNVDVSGQPSGSSLKWRWGTASGTAPKLLSVALWGSE